MPTDERLADLLRVVGQPAEPDPRFLDQLYHHLAVELGYRPAARPARGHGIRRRHWWLPIAALLATSVAAAALVAGGALRLVEERRPDALDVIRERGVILVDVRDSAPQARSRQGVLGGFEIDVAHEIASRLGVRADIRAVGSVGSDATTEAGERQLAIGSAWDAARSDDFLTSTPIYHWPVHVVVPRGATIGSIDALTGARICAVMGSPGHAWLTGRFDGGSTTPAHDPPVGVAVARPDDEACLDALAAGTVAAAVTARMGPAELAVRGDIRVIEGPVLIDAHAILVDREIGGAGGLLAEIDAAVEAARADGTLSDLARARFGGHDLSVPPPISPKEG